MRVNTRSASYAGENSRRSEEDRMPAKKKAKKKR
jgi:hypothetical protein